MGDEFMMIIVSFFMSAFLLFAGVSAYLTSKRSSSTALGAPVEGGELSAADAEAGATGVWKAATCTWFQSWPACCKGSPAYDSKASKTECSDNSGCKYQGDFQTGRHLSFEQVKSTRLCAFYDIKQKDTWKGDKNPLWESQYRDKFIYIRKTGDAKSVMKIQILDTCKDSDCKTCCTKNAQKGGGYLIDLEWYTAQLFFKNPKPTDMSKIEWRFA